MTKEKCVVKILSSGNGWNDKRLCFGTLMTNEKTDGTKVFYQLDNDACVMTVTPQKVVQQRSGNNELFITFMLGQKTYCEIGGAVGHGGYFVETKRLNVVKTSKELHVSLYYLCGEDKEEVVLDFIAKIK